MIKPWLKDLTDDYLIEWGNKGLLRRGNKQLAKENPTEWLLDDISASASIDGHTQQLSGVGFEQLSCSCPSPGPCFHLTCFLTGLKQRVLEDVSTETPTVEKEEGHGDSAQPSELLTPWLIEEDTTRLKLLGKSAVSRAQRWIHQGITADFELTEQHLLAHVDEKSRHRLIIPRQGGIESAICSCKKAKCVHIAMAVLLQCQQQGIAFEDEGSSGLDDWQQQLLQQLKEWLAQLAAVGMNGINRLIIDQGVALATEIRQADLPRVGRQLMAVCNMLEEEYDRQLISSPSRLRKMIAVLYASVSGLTSKPMPLPYLQLAGEYRRQYRETRGLQLIGLCTDFWQSLNGFRGYTSYFYNPEGRCFYTLTDARDQRQDPNWRAEKAFRDGELSGVPINELLSQEFYLAKCWTSSDARLSSKPETKIANRASFDVQDLLPLCTSIKSITDVFLEHIRQQPLQEPLSKFYMVEVGALSTLRHDRFQQTWAGEGTDATGTSFRIHFDGASQQLITSQYSNNHGAANAIFGSWQLLDGELAVTPIALITPKSVISLSRMKRRYA